VGTMVASIVSGGAAYHVRGGELPEGVAGDTKAISMRVTSTADAGQPTMMPATSSSWPSTKVHREFRMFVARCTSTRLKAILPSSSAASWDIPPSQRAALEALSLRIRFPLQ
jgi:hypothetical protein